MDIQTQDGILLRNIPDGTPDEVIKARIQKIRTSQPESESPTSGRNLLGAAWEPLATMASGAVATPLAGLAGIGTTVGNAVGLTDKDPASVVGSVQSGLTYQPKTEGGQNAMSVLGAPFEALQKGSRFAGEKVQDLTGSPIAATQVETLLNVLPGLVGMPKGMMAPTNMAGDAGRAMSRALMQSAMKPSVADLRSGAATRAVQTMLDEGVNATKGGVRKLDARIADVNDSITEALANSNATISRADVAKRLDDVRAKVGNQVTPTADLAAVDAVAKDFGTQPSILPIQYAQALKQGTYRQLSDKFGEMGSASVESQKGLARGLKEEISAAAPEVAPMNDRASALIQAKQIAEHRALMDANRNPMGLAPIAPTSAKAVGMLADRSAWVKSVLARLLNPGKGMGATDAALVGTTAPQSFTEDMRNRELAMLAQILRQGQ